MRLSESELRLHYSGTRAHRHNWMVPRADFAARNSDSGRVRCLAARCLLRSRSVSWGRSLVSHLEQELAAVCFLSHFEQRLPLRRVPSEAAPPSIGQRCRVAVARLRPRPAEQQFVALLEEFNQFGFFGGVRFRRVRRRDIRPGLRSTPSPPELRRGETPSGPRSGYPSARRDTP